MFNDSMFQSSNETNQAWTTFTTEAERGLWDEVASKLTQYGLASLVPTVTNLIAKYGSDMPETINTELRESEAYKKRFAGNELRRKANLPVLSEGEYLYNELQYHQTLTAYGASDLATSDNYTKFIGGDISPTELSNRFDAAVTKINQAYAGNDKALLDELTKMYPGASREHLATSILLGSEGSQYLKNKFGVAEIKAAQTETGYKSQIGADYLQAQGIDRNQARQGFAQTANQMAGLESAANLFGDTRTAQERQTELEKENLLGQQSKRNKELASRARANFGGAAGVQSQSLQRKDVGNI